MQVIKRDGREVSFDRNKIITAIKAAADDINEKISEETAQTIATRLYQRYRQRKHAASVEDIQEDVERELMKEGAYSVAQQYIRYRYKQELLRNANHIDDSVLRLVELENETIKQENSNKNPTVVSVQRDYIAGEVSKDITNRRLLPPDIVEAHNQGIIHFHDADYFLCHEHNCDLINLDDMLQNGTVISGTLIEKPHSFSTACNITTQIIAQVASCQYGGQSISLAALAPFVDVSRKNIRKNVEKESEFLKHPLTDTEKEVLVEDRVKEEIRRGVQTIQYQVVTLMTTNGQAPFITVFMYIDEVPEGQVRHDLCLIIEEVLRQRYKGVQNEKGVWITPAFPKLIYCLDEDNIYPESKYYYLTQLAAKCTAKRMVPDYISAKIMRELKGDVYTCMGCRSFLTPDRFTDTGIGNIARAKNYAPHVHKYVGRFNQGVVTVNLVDAALSAEPQIIEEGLTYLDETQWQTNRLDKFWKILGERLELCHKALRIRHERLKGTVSDVAPILWQYGALARLDKGETIDKLLYDGYSTISLGYAGLWECVYALIGKKLTEPEGEKLGLEIMNKLNEYTAKWKAAENIDYSLYGTPIESTTYKFAKCLQKRFGIIPGVTDKNYITNSYHVHVTENIDAFDKLALEAKFQALSPGGAISYVEVPNMQNNLDAVLTVIKFIYENIMYAELNTKSDYCQVCGFDGEIEIKVDDNGKLVWTCPNCGNNDESKLNVARRTCGYIGTQFWCQGRTQEIKERALHL